MLFPAVALIACMLSACSFSGDKPDQVVVDVSPTPAPTQTPAPTAEPTAPPENVSTTYISSDNTVTITVPDSTWANKTDDGTIVSFESPEQGKITITHRTGADVDGAVIPDSLDMAVGQVRAAGLEETDFEIQNYQNVNQNGVDIITYLVHYLNPEKSEGAVSRIYRILVADQDRFDVEGLCKNEAFQAGIQGAVDNFQALGDSAIAQVTDPAFVQAQAEAAAAAAAEAAAAEAAAASGTDGYSAEALEDNTQTRAIYAEDGRGFVVSVTAEGNWVDKEGNVYTFDADGETVYGPNDVDFWYGGEPGNVIYMSVEDEEY